MQGLDRDSTGVTLRHSMLPGASAAEIHEAGVYLTDEVFLYRVLALVPSEGDPLVELEDCYGLDVVRVPIADVNARRLRVVTPMSVRGPA
ncbi:MAG: hypothetical protein ACXVUE_05165 [Solirubrobacteraceae bacterium]